MTKIEKYKTVFNTFDDTDKEWMEKIVAHKRKVLIGQGTESVRYSSVFGRVLKKMQIK